MGLYQSLSGRIRVRLISADIERTLSAANEMGIPLQDVQLRSELEAEVTVAERYRGILEKVTVKNGGHLKTLSRRGAYWTIRRLMKRPVLTFGCLLLFLATIVLSGRILFVSIEGNSRIPDQKILEAAKTSGISFGAVRRQVRSEVVKNNLLSQIPQLQWAGVNTYGCHAVITVREREDSEEAVELPGISSIVADRDGVILSCTVTEGTGLCTVGQTVKTGEVLISGYSDRGISISGSHAHGEITAETRRNFSAVTPQYRSVRTENTGMKERYSLIIGKKHINFYKGSGIYDGSCVKMYSKYVLSLPGGFELPVALVKESIFDYTLTEESVSDSEAETRLSDFADFMLRQSMIAGKILDRSENFYTDSGFVRLDGQYACTEMIGRRQEEMIGEYHGENDRTDRQRGSGG